MKERLKSGSWYRLELPLEKIYIAEYRRYYGESGEGWFIFPDGSQKDAASLHSYLSSIIEIDRPDPKVEYDIGDFIDE
jgi:hypothetical protein